MRRCQRAACVFKLLVKRDNRHAELPFVVHTLVGHSNDCPPVAAHARQARSRLQNAMRKHMPAMALNKARETIAAKNDLNPRLLGQHLASVLFAPVGPQAAFHTYERVTHVLRGHPFTSFWHLQGWAHNMSHADAGGDDDTHVFVRTSPCLQLGEDGDPVRVNGAVQNLDGTHWYESVAVVLGPAVRAWPHMPKLVEVDACHCNSAIGGCLYVMTGITANRNTVILAFGHASNESHDTWAWFLSQVKGPLNMVALGDRLAIVCDQDKGLETAIPQELPAADSQLCGTCTAHRVCSATLLVKPLVCVH